MNGIFNARSRYPLAISTAILHVGNRPSSTGANASLSTGRSESGTVAPPLSDKTKVEIGIVWLPKRHRTEPGQAELHCFGEYLGFRRAVARPGERTPCLVASLIECGGGASSTKRS